MTKLKHTNGEKIFGSAGDDGEDAGEETPLLLPRSAKNAASHSSVRRSVSFRDDDDVLGSKGDGGGPLLPNAGNARLSLRRSVRRSSFDDLAKALEGDGRDASAASDDGDDDDDDDGYMSDGIVQSIRVGASDSVRSAITDPGLTPPHHTPSSAVVHPGMRASLHHHGGGRSDNRKRFSILARFVRRTRAYYHWTESLRQKTRDHRGIVPAAYLLRDAVLGDNRYEDSALDVYRCSFDAHDARHRPIVNRISLVCQDCLGKRSVRKVVTWSTYVLVLLGFIEPPRWCRTDGMEDGAGGCDDLLYRRGPPAFYDPSEDGNDAVEYYPNWHTDWLTVRQSWWIEAACAAVLVANILLHVGRDGMSLSRYLDILPRMVPGQGLTFHRPKSKSSIEDDEDTVDTAPAGLLIDGHRVRRSVMFVSVCALVWSLVSVFWFEGKRICAPFLRIVIFVTMSKAAQRELVTVVRLTPELLSILVLLLIIVFFYAWIGVAAFYETHEGSEAFSNIVEAMWTLWICITTANYPDVMMSAYNQSRFAAFYFVSFMVVTFFFMMNVILASVVNSYNQEMDLREEGILALERYNLKEAFRLLDRDKEGVIDRDTVMAIFLVLNENCPGIKPISREKAELLFAVLDTDGTNAISQDEFMSFSRALLLEFEKSSVYATFVEQRFPRTFESSWFQKLRRDVQSERFEHIIDGIVLLNAIVVAIQSWPELAGRQRKDNPHIADGFIDTPWEVLETVFTIVYCIEMTVKILVLGWRRYKEQARNIFDMVITFSSFFSTCYVYYPNQFSDARLIRYIVMARVLRLFRVIVAMRQFQVIGRTFNDILPAALRIVLLLFCIMYTFSAFGMEMFGGMITRDPSNDLSYLLNDSDFADNSYWANNFNDMISGMNVLFNLLVVNNWTEMADGILAVTDNKWSRLFFLMFHILGVIIVDNIVVAFIIDSFLGEWKTNNEQAAKDIDTGDAKIVTTDDARAFFDATEVTGTKTNLSGEYVARWRKAERHRRVRSNALKDLFTKKDSTTGSFTNG